MRSFVLILSLIGSCSCAVDVSFDSTAFTCGRTSECPPNYECDGDVCRLSSTPGADAGLTVDAASPSDATSCPAADVDGEVTAWRAGGIAIDGTLESIWDDARFVEFSNAAQSENRARVRLLWDDTHLYLAFEITDGQLEAVGEPNRIFLDDGSEFYLDMNHDESPELGPDDVHYIANIDGVVQSGALETAVSLTSTGYVIEHGLAWSETVRAPIGGETIGMLLGNNDRDNDQSSQFDWRDLIDSGLYTRPNLWGDLHLSAIDASSCP